MTLPVQITGEDEHQIDEPTNFTVNRAIAGDDRVVISWNEPFNQRTAQSGPRQAAGFRPEKARLMARALLAAADAL